MDVFSLNGLFRFAEECLKMDTAYMWGSMGELLTPVQILTRRNKYPEHFKEEQMRRLYKRCNGKCRAFDCSGLIKRYFMGSFNQYIYKPEYDLNCASMFELSQQKGTIDGMPEIPGICLFMEGHTGVYAGNGTVIEATPNPLFGDGVVETKLSDRVWTHWYIVRWIR